MAKSNKKAISTGSAILIGGAVLVGGYLYMNGTPDSLSTADKVVEQSSAMPEFYVSTLTATNTSLFTVTTAGSGADTVYTIEVDADTLGNSARTETFTIGVTQDVAGTSSLNTIENYHKVLVPFQSDVELKDTSDVSHVLMSFSSSTFDSKKGYQVLTLAGSTEVTKTLSVRFNPNAANLGTLSAINDVGESHQLDWDFGQSNKVIFKIKE